MTFQLPLVVVIVVLAMASEVQCAKLGHIEFRQSGLIALTESSREGYTLPSMMLVVHARKGTAEEVVDNIVGLTTKYYVNQGLPKPDEYIILSAEERAWLHERVATYKGLQAEHMAHVSTVIQREKEYNQRVPQLSAAAASTLAWHPTLSHAPTTFATHFHARRVPREGDAQHGEAEAASEAGLRNEVETVLLLGVANAWEVAAAEIAAAADNEMPAVHAETLRDNVAAHHWHTTPQAATASCHDGTCTAPPPPPPPPTAPHAAAVGACGAPNSLAAGRWLRLWLELFPGARVVAVDPRRGCGAAIDAALAGSPSDRQRVQFVAAHTWDVAALASAQVGMQFDVVVDSSNLNPVEQVANFHRYFAGVVAPGGEYVVMDTQTSHFDAFRVDTGFGRQPDSLGGALHSFAQLFHSVNFDSYKRSGMRVTHDWVMDMVRGARPDATYAAHHLGSVSLLDRIVASVSFYDGIVSVRRAPAGGASTHTGFPSRHPYLPRVGAEALSEQELAEVVKAAGSEPALYGDSGSLASIKRWQGEGDEQSFTAPFESLPTLTALAYTHGCDKATPLTWHFGATYWQLLLPTLVGNPGLEVRNMIEIGVYYGGSLRMWSTLLPETTVVGIDIEDYTALHDDGDHVRVVVGDQAAAEVMDKALALLDGPPELVIDDGSHIPSHQIASLKYLLPRVAAHGVFVIEDLQTNYYRSFDNSSMPDNMQHTAVALLQRLVTCRGFQQQAQGVEEDVPASEALRAAQQAAQVASGAPQAVAAFRNLLMYMGGDAVAHKGDDARDAEVCSLAPYVASVEFLHGMCVLHRSGVPPL